MTLFRVGFVFGSESWTTLGTTFFYSWTPVIMIDEAGGMGFLSQSGPSDMEIKT